MKVHCSVRIGTSINVSIVNRWLYGHKVQLWAHLDVQASKFCASNIPRPLFRLKMDWGGMEEFGLPHKWKVDPQKTCSVGCDTGKGNANLNFSVNLVIILALSKTKDDSINNSSKLIMVLVVEIEKFVQILEMWKLVKWQGTYIWN